MEYERKEANLNMEIGKLKKRNEELEALGRDKNSRLTELNIEINNLEKKNSDLSSL